MCISANTFFPNPLETPNMTQADTRAHTHIVHPTFPSHVCVYEQEIPGQGIYLSGCRGGGEKSHQ